jgi:parvulin-like peptidyl-prolyl isomerase
MLQAMRRNMKVVLWITVIFFVLLIFLVWGADLQFGSGPVPNTVGSVNGESIPITIYQQVLAANRQSAQAQEDDLEPSDFYRIQEQTWNTIVDEMLLEQEAKRRGLGASDAEVRAVLFNDPPPFIVQDPAFRNAEGQFDLAAYHAVLRDPSTPEAVLLRLEGYVRDTLPLQKLQYLVVASAKVTEDELRRSYLERTAKAKITYVLADAFQTKVDTEVSDEELTAYFEEHRQDYREPKRADAVHLTVVRRPTPADTLLIQQDLADMARQARRAEEAKTRGDVDVTVSDFETLAMTFSDAPTAEEGGLSAGFLTLSEMSPGFREAVTGLARGEISEPFQDGNMFHIVMIVDEKEEEGGRAVQLRDLAMRIQPSDSTLMAVTEQLETIRREAEVSGLQAAAQAHGHTAREAKDVRAGSIVPGLSSLPDIAQFVLGNPEGTVSRVYSTNAGWHIVQVGAHKEPRLSELEEVKTRVRGDVLRERRMAASRATIDRFLGRIKLGEAFEQAAESESLVVTTTPELTRSAGIPTLGREAELLAATFDLPLGEISDPLESSRGWAVVRVDERPELDWTEFEERKAVLSQTALAIKQNRIMDAFLESLRQDAEIVDYRGRF